MATDENGIGRKVQRLRAQMQSLCDPLQNLCKQMEAIEVMGVRFSPLFAITQFDPFSNPVNSIEKDTTSNVTRNQSAKPFGFKAQENKQYSTQNKELSELNLRTTPRMQDVQSGSLLKNGDTRLHSSIETEHTKNAQSEAFQTPLFKLHTLQQPVGTKVSPPKSLPSTDDKNAQNLNNLTESIWNTQKDIRTNRKKDTIALQNGHQKIVAESDSNQKQIQTQSKIATVKELLSAKSYNFGNQKDLQSIHLPLSGNWGNSASLEGVTQRDSGSKPELENSHWTFITEPLLEAMLTPSNSTKNQQSDINIQNIIDSGTNIQSTLPGLKNNNKIDHSQTQTIQHLHSGLSSEMEPLTQSSKLSSQIPDTARKESTLYSSEDISEMVNTVLLQHAKIHGVERL